MWDKIQVAFKFLVKLGPVPKAIFSAVVIGAVILLLVLIWFPPPTPPEPEPAVSDILAGCYRRALFPRMHAQLDTKSMVTSIDACRITVQMNIPRIHRQDLRAIAVKLLSTLDQILHLNPEDSQQWPAINALKLEAIQSFKQLAAATGDTYKVPDDGKLAESAYFGNEQAAAPPTKDEIDTGNMTPAAERK